jgi:hypothetical protein
MPSDRAQALALDVRLIVENHVRALGIEVPQGLLLIADEVIEL